MYVMKNINLLLFCIFSFSIFSLCSIQSNAQSMPYVHSFDDTMIVEVDQQYAYYHTLSCNTCSSYFLNADFASKMYVGSQPAVGDSLYVLESSTECTVVLKDYYSVGVTDYNFSFSGTDSSCPAVPNVFKNIKLSMSNDSVYQNDTVLFVHQYATGNRDTLLLVFKLVPAPLVSASLYTCPDTYVQIDVHANVCDDGATYYTDTPFSYNITPSLVSYTYNESTPGEFYIVSNYAYAPPTFYLNYQPLDSIKDDIIITYPDAWCVVGPFCQDAFIYTFDTVSTNYSASYMSTIATSYTQLKYCFKTIDTTACELIFNPNTITYPPTTTMLSVPLADILISDSTTINYEVISTTDNALAEVTPASTLSVLILPSATNMETIDTIVVQACDSTNCDLLTLIFPHPAYLPDISTHVTSAGGNTENIYFNELWEGLVASGESYLTTDPGTLSTNFISLSLQKLTLTTTPALLGLDTIVIKVSVPSIINPTPYFFNITVYLNVVPALFSAPTSTLINCPLVNEAIDLNYYLATLSTDIIYTINSATYPVSIIDNLLYVPQNSTPNLIEIEGCKTSPPVYCQTKNITVNTTNYLQTNTDIVVPPFSTITSYKTYEYTPQHATNRST